MSLSIEKTDYQDYGDIIIDTPRLREVEMYQKNEKLLYLGWTFAIIGAIFLALGLPGLTGHPSYISTKVISGILVGLGGVGLLTGSFFMSRMSRIEETR